MSFTSVLWEFNFYTVICQILSDRFHKFFHVYTSMDSALIEEYRAFPPPPK